MLNLQDVQKQNTMRRLFGYLVAVLTAISLTSSCVQKTEAEKYVDDLMDKMTLREKLGQMTQVVPSTGVITGPGGGVMNIGALIKAGEVGSMLGVRRPEDFEKYQRMAVDSSRLGIPILFGFDIIHGCKVIFPINLGSACSWNMDAIRESARIAAYEAAAMGLAWTFSPMCDISADPRWGRVSEGAGEDPYLGAAISRAMVEGYQGDDLSDSTTILACVKHFAAYGAPEAGRDYNTVDMSERMFRDRYLPPYKSALDAGALSVMSSFNDYDGIPASGSRWLLKDLLRDELGFKGFVVSDYDAIIEMVNHGVAADKKEAALKSLRAYLDMEMVSGSYLNHGEELVEEGLIDIDAIDQMCRNILLVKYQLGLFEDPFRYGGVERAQKSIYKPEHLEFARKVARESMVLLKNDEEVLPLKNGSRIALIGPYVADGGAMLGSWTGCGERDKAVTIEKGMKSRFSGNVQVVKGCGPFEKIEGGIDEAVKAARRADVAVLTLGYPGALSGEAASMTSVELPQVQKELLEAVRKTGTPVVVLLVTGRPMALESVEPMMDGLLVVWHPGSEGGNAVADLLSGDYSPSGHLAMTFPRCDGQIPIRYNHKATGRPTERTQGVLSLDNMHKYYKSCYLFTPNTPLYPFGYGLSYTQFSYDSLEVVNPLVAMGEDVVIKARVTNTGKKDGATVAQLYVHDMVASTTRPVRELKGFKRVELKAGESAELEFILKPSDLAFCREDMKFAVEPGDFMVWVGDDCNASEEGRFTIK